jgi:hypothetical protein
MKLDETGPGVFLLPGWSKISPRPKDFLPRISGSLAKPEWEEALVLLIQYSVNHNAWCGVRWTQMLSDMRKSKSEEECTSIKTAVEEMLQQGLLQVPGHSKWGMRWLNMFSKQTLCPTHHLLAMVLWKTEMAQVS